MTALLVALDSNWKPNPKQQATTPIASQCSTRDFGFFFVISTQKQCICLPAAKGCA